MEGLFNPVSILLHVINAVILFLVVSRFIYKPVRKFMKAREDKVEQQLNEARTAREEVGESLKKRDEALRSADQQVETRLADGRKRLQEQEAKMLASAQAERDEIIARAHQEADAILKNAHESMEAQATALAMDIARAVLGREVRREDHEELIADFLKKVG